MRYLLIILFLPLVLIAEQKGAWRAESQLDGKVFWEKQLCEKRMGEPCLFVKDHLISKIVLVDDETKPKFRHPKDSPVLIECKSRKDCKEKSIVDEKSVCTQARATWDKVESWPGITLDSKWFIWCEKAIGFKKKKVVRNDDEKKKAKADKRKKTKDKLENALKRLKAVSDPKLKQIVDDILLLINK